MFSIFFIVGFAVFLGLALAILITRHKPNSEMALVPIEEEAENQTAEVRDMKLDSEALFALGERLCRENSLAVKDKIINNEREIYWIAESQNQFFYGSYVLGFILGSPQPVVTMPDVLEFKDFIKSMGSAKGFLFTNGYFTRDVHQPLEGPKVALYNRRKVVAEMKRLSLI